MYNKNSENGCRLYENESFSAKVSHQCEHSIFFFLNGLSIYSSLKWKMSERHALSGKKKQNCIIRFLPLRAAAADCHRRRFCLICCFAVVLAFIIHGMHIKELEQNPWNVYLCWVLYCWTINALLTIKLDSYVGTVCPLLGGKLLLGLHSNSRAIKCMDQSARLSLILFWADFSELRETVWQ